MKWSETTFSSTWCVKDSWPEAKVILEQSIGRHLTEQLVFGYQPAIVQLHFVGQQSSCFAREVINLFIDLDRLMDGIDHHLLDTMKRLFGWEYFLGLWGALWAPSFVSLFSLREAITCQLCSFFKHCSNGGGGSNPCWKILLQIFYYSKGLFGNIKLTWKTFLGQKCL